MTYLTEANKNWKQAQSILKDVQIDIWFGINEIGQYEPEYHYNNAITKLQTAYKNNELRGNDESSLNWVQILIDGLKDAIISESAPPPANSLLLPCATQQEQRNHDLGYLYTYQRQAFHTQKYALAWFTEFAKLDADIAQAKQSTVTKGSPLAKIISDQKKTKVAPIPDDFMDTPFHEYTIRSLRRRR